MLDPITLVELCISDLKLDPATGELVTPAELARRQTEGMVWDAPANEWVTPHELRQRERLRTREASTARREAGTEVYDAIAREWITPAELKRRTRERLKITRALAASGLIAAELPKLNILRSGLMRSGVVVEVDDSPADDQGPLETITDIVGPSKREEESRQRMRVVLLAALAAALATIVYSYTGNRRMMGAK